MRESNKTQFDFIDKKIREAMLYLLGQKKFDDIYIKDICDIAKINRSTFYNHYHDINDLMIKMENSIADQFRSIFDFSILHNKEMLRDYFNFIKENKDFYVAFMNSNYDFKISKGLVMDYISDHYTESDDQNNSKHETLYHQVFFDAGILAVTKYWIRSGMKESVEQMIDFVYNEYTNNHHFK